MVTYFASLMLIGLLVVCLVVCDLFFVAWCAEARHKYEELEQECEEALWMLYKTGVE